MSRNYSLGKAARTNVDEKTLFKGKRNMYLAKVIESDDFEAAGRIKVRIKGLDDKKTNEEIPYCWPFLPLYLNIQPKVNETVKVILYDSRNTDSYREYVGPVIPQLGDKLLGSDNFEDSKAGREGVQQPFDQSIKSIETTKVVLSDSTEYNLYPQYNEVAILGRNNSDLIFKDSEVLIRAAKALPNQPNVINEKNPCYIQIKSLNPGFYQQNPIIDATLAGADKALLLTEKSDETRTDIKMVSNKIFLIGRDTNSGIVKPFLTEEEEANIEQKLHPLVYGDILKDFIKKLWRWVQTHTHPYHNLPANYAESAYIELQNWIVNELPNLNSTNIFAGGDIPTKVSLNVVDNVDKTVNTGTLVRDNASIFRVDELDEPMINVIGLKVTSELDNKFLVELIVKNNSTDEIIISFSNTDTTLNASYNKSLSDLNDYFINQNIDTTKIKIPSVSDLKES